MRLPTDFAGAVAHAMVESVCTLVAQTDAAGRFYFVADSSLAALDYSREYLTRSSLLEITFSADVAALKTTLEATAADGQLRTCTVRLLLGLVTPIWVQLKVAALSTKDALSPNAQLLVCGQDISEWKAAEAKLSNMLRSDPLTGVGNRTLMQERIEQAVESARRTNSQFAVALLDLDGFKKINDSLGHGVGDEFLRAVTGRLKAHFSGTSTVIARMGGDEFVLLIQDARTLPAVKAQAQKVLALVHRPFYVEGRALQVSTSIGIALYPEHGTTETELLKHADVAMYRAKERGKNGFHLFNREMESSQARALSLELAMLEGVRNGQFDLHYQPICDPVTKQMRGVEALMRWCKDGENIPPSEFIPLSEANGLVNLLGEWSLRAACMQLSTWDQMGLGGLYVSVNVSPRQFHQPGFPNAVWSALAEANLPGNRLMLEITETALMVDPTQAAAVLSELRQLGIRLALDDFGTGYSSLSQLTRFPLAALKIDRSFVTNMTTSPENRAVVSVILGLARELKLTAIAEGVETEEERLELVAQGCDLIQGWLIAKALPAGELEAQVKSGRLGIQGAHPEATT